MLSLEDPGQYEFLFSHVFNVETAKSLFYTSDPIPILAV